jgi:predicted nucleic acid-binding protein
LIFVDTDIFVIDKLFPRDHRYKVNKRFLEEAQQKATSVYNLLELCGLGSFALTVTELTTLFTSFHTQYDLRVLYPRILRASPDEMIRYQVSKVFEKICLKMNYPDAQILLIAEEYGCSEFVTWNTKHFDGRTHLPVKTPQDMVADSDKQ